MKMINFMKSRADAFDRDETNPDILRQLIEQLKTNIAARRTHWPQIRIAQMTINPNWALVGPE